VLEVSVEHARSSLRGLAIFIALDDGTRMIKSCPHDARLTIEGTKARSGYVKLARPKAGWRAGIRRCRRRR
jgi:hypothetical protein